MSLLHTYYGTNNCWSDVLIRDMSRSEAAEFILTGFNMENCEIRQKDSGTIEARHYYEGSKCWMPYAFVNRVGPFTYLGLHSNFDKSW